MYSWKGDKVYAQDGGVWGWGHGTAVQCLFPKEEINGRARNPESGD